jgi:magnesium transporter
MSGIDEGNGSQAENHDNSIIYSKNAPVDDLLNEKLEMAFLKDTSQFILHDVIKIAIEHDPIDLAYAVSRLPSAARIIVYENLPDLSAKITFMINTGRNTRSVIFRQIPDSEIKSLVENMPPDEAVDLLDDLPNRRLKRVLDLLSLEKAAKIRDLQKHERHTAGRLMSNEFFAFPMSATLGEVARHVRDNPGVDVSRSIFVLTNEGTLAGYVPIRNLIVNPPFLPLRQVMRPIIHTVTPDASRDEVVDVVERYQIPMLPVVDEKEKLVGIIAYEDVVEMMEDIADETIANIAGTAEDVSEHESILKRFMWRAPWLIVTLCAGLMTSTAMAHFSTRIWFAFVPFFVPLINGMSGNVGLQCSTILVRGMATGELSRRKWKDAMFKEIMIGLLIGIAFGISCGLVVFTLNSMGIMQPDFDPVALGTIVSCGVLGACLTASAIGTFFPLFFARIGIDPAVASGPLVTAFNDVSATLIFFLVTKIVYTLFF